MLVNYLFTFTYLYSQVRCCLLPAFELKQAVCLYEFKAYLQKIRYTITKKILILYNIQNKFYL